MEALSLQELEDVFPGELGDRLVVAADDFLDDAPLPVLHLNDLFFDRAVSDQLVDRDRLFLSNTVNTVGGLVFDGGVPPHVVVDDGVSADEVESCSSCF